MLKRMHKSIVCEGVETEVIADFLKNEGCNEIQGFLYYRPMCQEDFEKLILKYQTFEKTQDNKTSEANLSSEELSWKTKNPEEIQVTNE